MQIHLAHPIVARTSVAFLLVLFNHGGGFQEFQIEALSGSEDSDTDSQLLTLTVILGYFPARWLLATTVHSYQSFQRFRRHPVLHGFAGYISRRRHGKFFLRCDTGQFPRSSCSSFSFYMSLGFYFFSFVRLPATSPSASSTRFAVLLFHFLSLFLSLHGFFFPFLSSNFPVQVRVLWLRYPPK